MRAFVETTDEWRIVTVSLAGGLPHLVEAAVAEARVVANTEAPMVFCPPIAVLVRRDRARERDIRHGLALSVECDRHPQAALAKLGNLLGPPTVTVASG